MPRCEARGGWDGVLVEGANHEYRLAPLAYRFRINYHGFLSPCVVFCARDGLTEIMIVQWFRPSIVNKGA